MHQRLDARRELLDVGAALAHAIRLRTGCATIRRRSREQRHELGAIARLREPLAVAIEIELDEAQRAERTVERARRRGLMKVAARLAPRRTDVDEDGHAIAATARDLVGDERRRAAGRGRRDDLDLASRRRRAARARGEQERGGEQTRHLIEDTPSDKRVVERYGRPVTADPPPPGALVAVRDRREQVIAALADSFAQDLFDVDEFERRIDLAHRATSLAELDKLVVDLAAPATSTALVPAPATEALANWPAKRAVRGILGGFDKKGSWTVARRITATAFWGGGRLDFREARFAPGVTELRVTAIMGGIEIIVPPWLAVECDATSIMGGFEELERGNGSPDPGRALLRITGFALMGGVSIETRLPGETRRDARKRIKKERKQLADASQRALPDKID